MGFINRVSQGTNIELGRIDLLQNFSFFEVPERQAKTAIKVLAGTDFDGRTVNVEITDNNDKNQHGNDRRGGSRRDDHGRGRRDDRSRRSNSERSDRNERGGRKGKEDMRSAKGSRRGSDNGSDTKGPKGAAEWAKYFEGQVEAQPFYDGFRKKNKKK